MTTKVTEEEGTMVPTEILKKPYARVLIPEADGQVSAEIMEFPGCVAFGANATEALARLEEVAVDWLSAAIEQGQDIPDAMAANDYSGRLVLRMPKGLHRRAAICAEREGASLNQFIVTRLAEAVGERSRQSAGTQTFSVAAVNTWECIGFVVPTGPLLKVLPSSSMWWDDVVVVGETAGVAGQFTVGSRAPTIAAGALSWSGTNLITAPGGNVVAVTETRETKHARG